MLYNTETWGFQVYNLNTLHKGDKIQQNHNTTQGDKGTVFI
jgi:hypothetical protein